MEVYQFCFACVLHKPHTHERKFVCVFSCVAARESKTRDGKHTRKFQCSCVHLSKNTRDITHVLRAKHTNGLHTRKKSNVPKHFQRKTTKSREGMKNFLSYLLRTSVVLPGELRTWGLHPQVKTSGLLTYSGCQKMRFFCNFSPTIISQ